MRYNYYSRFCKIVFAILVGLPLTTLAQVEKISYMRPSYWRPYDQTGINVFETTKQADPVPFDGLRVRFGAGFTQQFQNLKHKNPTAVSNEGAGTNRLYPLTSGFMTSQANLFMDVQLADGIRLNVTSYLSARHHNETWVKGGYIQFDKLPFKGKFWDDVMKLTTIKIGHMEINYGDAHFRRSDGGQTLYNPFMDNNIMDEFATEIGGEVYVQKSGFIGMVGLTNGMIKGNVDSAYKTAQDADIHKSPSIYGKLAYDKTIDDNLRVRFSASYYYNKSSASSGLTIFGGDRTGSNYQNVMEKGVPGALPASTAVAFSGRFNPGFSKKINAYMLNTFIKAYGFEFFGTYEGAKGRTKTEINERKATQYNVEGVYRFGKSENLFAGLRYNSVKAGLANTTAITYTGDVTVNRFAAAAGWFLTKNILLKGEIVNQHYKDFPTADYRSGGKFYGYVVEAVVGF
jgi:hypothetical protein